jgi:hypothetical protein
MMDLVRQHPLVSAISGFVLGAVLVLTMWGLVSAASGSDERASPPETTVPSASPSATAEASPTPSPEENAVTSPLPGLDTACDDPSITVDDEEGLADGIASAAPGDTIELSPGRYEGGIVATTSGTADAPITLCGPQSAVIDGGGTGKGYVVHLDGASHWRLLGFTVTNGQKGVMADTTVGSVIGGLTVQTIGDEAIHLRKFSTDNLVIGNTISDTGIRKPKFGEGVYIGTAESNWCDISDCQPDASDRNTIEGNVISATTSESIDLKEGSSDGIVRGNMFNGASITGADSWVDAKGNGYLIVSNTGVNSPMDGFQTHEILDGWGTGNIFRGNVATVNGPGFGYSLTPARDNVVECDNTATGAGEGLSNVECSR